ncbi:MAG: hypothetical protein SF187_12060 [Deltaproteobacteria bacterium]|nr:hypothetical protein [Deltaproteobacteria bacterium]
MRAIVCLFVLIGLSRALPCAAAPRLFVQGAGGCPDAIGVCRELRSLGLYCAPDDEGAWKVELTDAGAYGHLSMWGVQGALVTERDIEGESCSDRSALAALVIEAVFLELGQYVRPSAPPASTTKTLPTAPVVNAPAAHVFLGLFGGLNTAIDQSLSRADVAVEAGRSWRDTVWASFVASLMQGASLSEGTTRVDLWGGRVQSRLGLSRRWGASVLDVGALLGASIQNKTAPAAPIPTSHLRVTPETGVVAGAAWQVSRAFVLRLELGVIYAISRDRLVIEGLGPVAIEPRWQGFFRAGVRWVL